MAVPETGRPLITSSGTATSSTTCCRSTRHPGFAQVITIGEIAVGVALLVGALTGVAAFFGATMNMSFLLAGSASTNPIMFALAIGLILAWKVSGWVGVDRYLLPLLGTPWQPGKIVPHRPAPGREWGPLGAPQRSVEEKGCRQRRPLLPFHGDQDPRRTSTSIQPRLHLGRTTRPHGATAPIAGSESVVPKAGVEPARPGGHRCLRPRPRCLLGSVNVQRM